MSSKPVPQSSAPAMASSTADLARPLGTKADTNLRRASAKKQVSKTQAVETAIHGTTGPIVSQYVPHYTTDHRQTPLLYYYYFFFFWVFSGTRFFRLTVFKLLSTYTAAIRKILFYLSKSSFTTLLLRLKGGPIVASNRLLTYRCDFSSLSSIDNQAQTIFEVAFRFLFIPQWFNEILHKT